MNKIQIGCPNWANVHAYEDCTECPTYRLCEDEYMLRTHNKMAMRKRLLQFREDISELWSEETKYPDSEENGFNAPSRGQCYVTAFVAWTEFGGEIVKGRVDDESHYWNRFLNYGETDFTSDQYGGDGMAPVTFVTEVMRRRNWDNPRVRLLLEKYRSLHRKVRK